MVAAAKSGAKARERRRMLEESVQSGSGSAATGGYEDADASTSAPTAAGFTSMGDSRSVVVNDAGNLSSRGPEQDEEQLDDDGFDDAGTDLTDVPLSFGERLILETCMRFRQRPYDRQRQEFLSKPKRRGDRVEAWLRNEEEGGGASGSGQRRQPGASSEQSGKVQDRVLNGEETNSLIARLSQPKKVKHSIRPAGEQIILRSRDKERDKIESGIDVNAIVARLSTPRSARMTSPTPGERMVLMWNKSDRLRPVDFNRINQLAKASRRGGSAHAWGVRASSLPSASASASTSSPQSAREPRGGSPPTRGKAAVGLGATEERKSPTRSRDAPPGQQSDTNVEKDASVALDESHEFMEEAILPGIDVPEKGTSGSPKDSHGANWAHPWRSGVDRFS